MTFSDGYGGFPPHEESDEYGLLAVGATLSADRLIYAYQNGIFPWYSEGEAIHWYSPGERCVFTQERFHISKSFRRVLARSPYNITMNSAFSDVIGQCAAIKRKDQDGETWIHADMINAYTVLHKRGIAQSVEVWKDGTLAGGLYGIVIGRVFCGESMFSIMDNASKCAIYYILHSESFDMLDAQIPNPHLMRMGAFMISRDKYLKFLKKQIFF